MKTYYTNGVCSTEIHFRIKDGILEEVDFRDGCPGGLSAISLLVKGMRVEDVICKLRGIPCEDNPTSCADQLAKALEEELGYSPQCSKAFCSK